MKIKKLLAVLLAGVLALSMVACGGSSAPAAAPAGDAGAAAPSEKAPAAPQITLNAAHVPPEDRSPPYGLILVKAKMEELSGGTMTL